MALHPMALAALLLFAGPADFPRGTIAAELGGTEWTIRFADDGKFTVSTDGEAVVEGKYEVTKDEIVLSDERGPRRSGQQAREVHVEARRQEADLHEGRGRGPGAGGGPDLRRLDAERLTPEE